MCQMTTYCGQAWGSWISRQRVVCPPTCQLAYPSPVMMVWRCSKHRRFQPSQCFQQCLGGNRPVAVGIWWQYSPDKQMPSVYIITHTWVKCIALCHWGEAVAIKCLSHLFYYRATEKCQKDVMSLSKQQFRYLEMMTGLFAGSKACVVLACVMKAGGSRRSQCLDLIARHRA